MKPQDNHPALTVGIPVYNSGGALRNAVNSVFEQTWLGTLEVLIVNDGSDCKETLELMAALEREIPEVIVHHHEENKGRPFARNTVLDHAKGKYLTWLDADDTWYPDKLREQFQCLYQLGLDVDGWICLCAYDWAWENSGRKRIKAPDLSGGALRGVISGKVGCYLWTMLCTTQTFRNVGRFDENLPRLQDLEFLIRFAHKGGRFVATNKELPLCIYNKSDTGRKGEVIEQCVKYIWNKHRFSFSSFGSRFERYSKQDHLALIIRHHHNNGKKMFFSRLLLEYFMNAPKRALRRYSRLF